MDFSLAATDSGPLHTVVFYCGESIFFTLMNRAGNIARHIQKFQSSRGHLCILSRKYFPIAAVDREKSENHNHIYFMAFGKLSEKLISTCGRGHYVMRRSCFTS